jgi:hypothetical protein
MSEDNYPRVVSSFYKAPDGPVRMFHMKSNNPLLPRDQVTELRIEHFFTKFVENLALGLGIEKHEDEPVHNQSSEVNVIKMDLQQQQQIANAHLQFDQVGDLNKRVSNQMGLQQQRQSMAYPQQRQSMVYPQQRQSMAYPQQRQSMAQPNQFGNNRNNNQFSNVMVSPLGYQHQQQRF